MPVEVDVRSCSPMYKVLAFLIPLAFVVTAVRADAPKPKQTRFEIAVTRSGFEPGTFTVPANTPVTLVFTRKTDQTCAKEIVIDEYNIHEKLPLNTPVTVAFTPNKSGQLRYGCAMNKMVSGVLTID